MLEAVPYKGAFAATAVASAAGGAWAAARVARWAARLAPEVTEVPEPAGSGAPRVVVPLIKPTGGHRGHPASDLDVGDTMAHLAHTRQHLHGAVQA